jgi:hypothetical protein
MLRIFQQPTCWNHCVPNFEKNLIYNGRLGLYTSDLLNIGLADRVLSMHFAIPLTIEIAGCLAEKSMDAYN